MKTKEELNALKEEVEVLNKKLAELTEEELAKVVGGMAITVRHYVLPHATTPAEKNSDATGHFAQRTLEMSTSEIVE